MYVGRTFRNTGKAMTMHGSLAPIDVIALDLEGTLISNAMSQFPRRGLRQFLDFCGWAAPRVVVYTAVREARARTILCTLVREGMAPAWFGDVEYIHWSGPFKDLRFIPECAPGRALLVDDHADYVHPSQRDQWIQVMPFVAPYTTDDELVLVRNKLEARCGTSHLRTAGERVSE
jgi:hypothetical protein